MTQWLFALPTDRNAMGILPFYEWIPAANMVSKAIPNGNSLSAEEGIFPSFYCLACFVKNIFSS
jgi:hypothetical protein